MSDVNKQLLERWAAFGKAMQKSGSELPRHLIADTEQAIAAAEQAKTVTLEQLVANLKAGEGRDAIGEAMDRASADMELGRRVREQAQQITDNTRVAWTSLGTVKAMLTELLASDDVNVRENAQIIDALVRLVGCQQQAEPRCACGDGFTSEAVCANCLAAQQQAEPVAWQYRARLANGSVCGDWHGCSKQVHDRYKSGEFNGDLEFEARELYSKPPAVAAPSVLVPVDPTEEMLASGQQAWLNSAGADPSFDIYRAMLAAQKGGA